MPEKPSWEELHQKVRDLERSIEIYRPFVNNSPDLFYRTSLDGKILYISPSVYRLSGYTVNEAIGMNLAEEIYLFPEERKIFIDKLQKKGQVANFQAQLKRKNGAIGIGLMSARILPINNEDVIQSITKDITERKMPRDPCGKVRNGYV